MAAHRYSRHSIWYFSLCIADSSNCSASRALIYRPAGPLSRPRGSELSFAYSHGTGQPTLPSPRSAPFRRMHSPPPLYLPFAKLSGSAGWSSFLTPGIATLFQTPSFPMALGYRSIYPLLLFFALFPPSLSLSLSFSSSWSKSTHTLRA